MCLLYFVPQKKAPDRTGLPSGAYVAVREDWWRHESQQPLRPFWRNVRREGLPPRGPHLQDLPATWRHEPIAQQRPPIGRRLVAEHSYRGYYDDDLTSTLVTLRISALLATASAAHGRYSVKPTSAAARDSVRACPEKAVTSY